MNLNEINEYIKKTYQVDTIINLNFANEEQICFKNKNLSYPFCSFYITLCPEWGYAPHQLLIHYSKTKKDHAGSSCSIIYEGMESIDWLMQNIFELEKKDQQLSLL